MAFLFNVEGKAVFPNTETLLLHPYKEIWERDKTKNKENALEELAYIEFMTSMKKTNPYRQYPEERKHDVIMSEVISQIDWQPDDLVIEAIEKLIDFQRNASTTYNYYMSAKVAAEKMQEFFNTVDINERNFKSGNPIYKPGDITRALNDTEKVLGNLKGLEKKVEEELYEEARTKGGKQISPFANRNSLK